MPVPIDRDTAKPAGATPHARTGAVGSPARPISVSVTGGAGGAGDPLRANLALMAPGTALRDGLERILRGRTGALIVLGYDKVVEGLCTGGFPLDVEFSATRVRELCKMDGGVVLSSDGTRIVRAAVHLMPDPTIPTEESGTRHRTAERIARQTGFPVISVSQSMRIISLYVNGQRHVLDDSAAILSRANQALATLERYKLRLDEVSGTLSALEIEDLVTVRDAVAVNGTSSVKPPVEMVSTVLSLPSTMSAPVRPRRMRSRPSRSAVPGAIDASVARSRRASSERSGLTTTSPS